MPQQPPQQPSNIEGLPTSRDPYAPAQRPETPGELKDLGFSEVSAQEGGEGLDDIGGEIPEGPALPPEPTGPTWEAFKLPNKKDMAFRRNDGFILRIRSLESVPGKFIAQLYTGDKLLNKGQVKIPGDVDPAQYVKDMADYMLDGDSNRYEQEAAPSGIEDFGKEPEGELPPEEGEAPNLGGGLDLGGLPGDEGAPPEEFKEGETPPEEEGEEGTTEEGVPQEEGEPKPEGEEDLDLEDEFEFENEIPT